MSIFSDRKKRAALHSFNFIDDRSGFKRNSKELIIDHHGYALTPDSYDPPNIIESEQEAVVPIERQLPYVRPDVLPDDPITPVDTDVI